MADANFHKETHHDQSSTQSLSNGRSEPPLWPPRSAPFDLEPGYYEPARLWLYGNVRLLGRKLGYVAEVEVSPDERDFPELERIAQDIALSGEVLVCGIHNPAHRRVAVVPLLWGAPRIIVLSGGFKYHLGEQLDREPFRAAQLWRYKWDPLTDLAISMRAPDKLPTYALHNPTVDRLIATIAKGEHVGLRSLVDIDALRKLLLKK